MKLPPPIVTRHPPLEHRAANIVRHGILRAHGVTLAQLQGKRRWQYIADIRHLIDYIFLEVFRWHEHDCQLFLKRERTTILHGARAMKNILATNAARRRKVEQWVKWAKGQLRNR